MDKRELTRLVKRKSLKALKVISKMETILPILENPTKTGAVVAAAKLVSSIVEEMEEDPWSYYEDWKKINRIPVLHSIFLLLVRERWLRPLTVRKESGQCFEGTFAGWTVGFMSTGSWTEGPYVLTEDPDEHAKVVQAMAEAIWHSLGDNIAVGTKGKDYGWEIKPDPLTESKPSPTSERLWVDLEQMIAEGHNRAVLLYGEAGTGKSYVIRDVIKKAGGRSVRIEFDQAKDLTDVDGLVEFLKPSALAIDDLDYAKDQSAIFSKFERLKRTCPLMLVSVNDVTKLTAASLRPGRFDTLYPIHALDEEVYRDMLSGISLSEEEFQRVAALPVAYISEFAKQAETWGVPYAVHNLGELEQRRLHIVSAAVGFDYDDGDDGDEGGDEDDGD